MSRPDDEKIIRAIIGKEATLTDEESRAELDAMTAEDYDDWVSRAAKDRDQGIVHLDPTGQFAEHPTTRLFRIGIESIRAGKPSEAFVRLLEKIGNRAPTSDVLKQVIGAKPIIPRTLDRAKQDATIAKEFQQFVKEQSGRSGSFSEKKLLFKKRSIHGSKTIDRALDKHHMNWEAQPGPAAGLKPRKEGL